MTSRYAEALEAKLDLLSDMARNRTWYESGFANIFSMGPRDSAAHTEAIRQTIELADPYFWCTDVAQSVWEASSYIPDEWEFDLKLLPSPEGFLWLETPIETEFDDGGKGWLRGFIWSGLDTQISDTTMPSLTEENVLDLTPRMRRVVKDVIEPHMAVMILISSRPHQRPFPLTTIIMPQGAPLKALKGSKSMLRETVRYVDDLPEEGYSNAAIRELRFLCGTLLFLDQQLVEARKLSLDRASRRRVERQLPPRASDQEPNTDVRVVLLRRTVHKSVPNPEAKPMEWSCQWLVKGFWRQQWYPSQQTHKLRWINDFWKGPEDKPIKIKQRVLAVVR